MSVGRVAFGSSSERTVFPLHYAPDRLGVQMPRQDAVHIGPGSYDSHQFGTIQHKMEKTPQSCKGYVVSARTAARFTAKYETVTPSPQQYQPNHSQSRVPPPSKIPFNSTTQRFRNTHTHPENNPGPGAYDPDRMTNRKVSWPMSFGRPKLPQPEINNKLTSEKELKQKNRLAYLSLYY